MTIQGSWGAPQYNWNYSISQNDELEGNDNVSVLLVNGANNCWLDRVNIFNSALHTLWSRSSQHTFRDLDVQGGLRKTGGPYGEGYFYIEGSDNLVTGCYITHLRHITIQKHIETNRDVDYNVIYGNTFDQELSFHTRDDGNNLVENNIITLPYDMPPVAPGDADAVTPTEARTNKPIYFAIMGPWSSNVNHLISANPNYIINNECLQQNHDFGTNTPWSQPGSVYTGPIKKGLTNQERIDNFPLVSGSCQNPTGATLYPIQLDDTDGPPCTGATQASLNPVADAFVRGSTYANTNYGSSNDLITKFVGNDKYHRKSYLKFDLTAYDATDLTSATLELKVLSNSGGSAAQNLFHVQDDNWAENSITWNNQPTSASLITGFTAPSAGQSVSIDISAAVISALNENKILTLKIEGTNNKFVTYASRERGGNDAPRLTLTLDCDDTPCPDSDNDGICDADDDTNGDCTLGASCDDNDPCTANDIYDANCNCAGTPSPDSDNDGICDAIDDTNGDCTLNGICDDGDPCIVGETYDANCNCGGGTPAGGNNSTDLLNPTDDTFIRGGTYANNNYGNSTTMHIKKGGNDKWTRYGYLKFDVSSVDVATLQSATFRIKVSANSNGSVAQELLLAPSDNWTESGLTWNNNQFGGTNISNFTAAASGQWVEIDVTSAVQAEAAGDGMISLAIISDNNSYIRYHTKESSGNAPELVLTYGSCNNKIQQYDETGIKIYPNPSRDYITIEMSDNLQEEIQQVSIYSLLGELLSVKNIELTDPIYIGDLAPGVYIIQVEGAGKKWSSRLMKN